MALEIVTNCKNDKTEKNYQEYAHDKGTRDNNNIFYSSLREIKAVVRSHNEEHISIILSH